MTGKAFPNGRASIPPLPEALDEARHELAPEEFSRSVRLAEEQAERATVRESWRWVLWLMMGAGLLIGVVGNAWLLLPTGLMMVWWCLPYIVAADVTAGEDAEARSLHEAAEQHRHGSKDA